MSATPYGQKALDGEIAELRQAVTGERNHAVYKAARRLGQLVAGDVLDESTVTEISYRLRWRSAYIPERAALPYEAASRAARGVLGHQRKRILTHVQQKPRGRTSESERRWSSFYMIRRGRSSGR